MKIRLTGLAVLLFTISVHAEISAPPALNPGKNAKKAEDIPVEPSPVAAPSVRQQIQTPIAFEHLAVDIEEDPELRGQIDLYKVRCDVIMFLNRMRT